MDCKTATKVRFQEPGAKEEENQKTDEEPTNEVRYKTEVILYKLRF